MKMGWEKDNLLPLMSENVRVLNRASGKAIPAPLPTAIPQSFRPDFDSGPFSDTPCAPPPPGATFHPSWADMRKEQIRKETQGTPPPTKAAFC